VLLALALSSGCSAEKAAPTARPFPTPDDRAIYAMMTSKYTSWDVIFGIHDMSAAESARILGALEAIQPPVDLEDLHQQAITAYQHVVEGKRLLLGADSILRAEAQFMIDWGVALLLHFREQFDAASQ
jgi:hypothetical protein